MEHIPPHSAGNRSILARMLLSPNERRPRAGWRLLGQLVIWAILNTVMIAIVGVIFSFGGITPSYNLSFFLAFFANALTITLSVFISRGYLDQRSFTSLGLAANRRGLIDFLTGIGISLLMFLVVFLIMLAAGWLRLDGISWQAGSMGETIENLLFYLVIMALVGWQEELLWRGYWLQNLADGLNLVWGVVISSAIFAVLHLLNPGASWASSLGIFLAGLFLAYGYLATRQLWLSIGLHIGWNFFLGPVFGFPVSGLETPSLFLHTNTGPDWITGGTFGPEAGLILLPGLFLGALLIRFYQRRWRTSEATG